MIYNWLNEDNIKAEIKQKQRDIKINQLLK